MTSVRELSKTIGVSKSCEHLGIARSSYYHWNKTKAKKKRKTSKPANALSSEETNQVLDLLYKDENIDLSIPDVFAKELDKGNYYCSQRTFYRILAVVSSIQDRRNQRKHPVYPIPRIKATKPNQVWVWDITYLKTSYKRICYYLYVIMDLYSRYVVGWLVDESQTAELGQELFEVSYHRQGIDTQNLILHSDRGTQMKAGSWSHLEKFLGVTRSFSRPRVSNDNPYIESSFKTLKFHPEYPSQFESIIDARHYLKKYFAWYNNEHHHSGICLLTPVDVHFNQANIKLNNRYLVIQDAYNRHPERFSVPPKRSVLPKEVWINQPDGISVDGNILM